MPAAAQGAVGQVVDAALPQGSTLRLDQDWRPNPSALFYYFLAC